MRGHQRLDGRVSVVWNLPNPIKKVIFNEKLKDMNWSLTIRSCVIATVTLSLYALSSVGIAQSNEADLYWELSENYNQNSNRDSAISILNRGIERFEESGTLEELATSYLYLGIRQQTYGKWDESAYAYTEALLLLENTEEYDWLKSKVYLYLGLLYIKTRVKDSDYYIDTAEKLALKSGNNEALFIIYKVTSRFEEGIEFAKRLGNNEYLTNYYYRLGKMNKTTEKVYLDSAWAIIPSLPKALLQNFQLRIYLSDYFLEEELLDSSLYYCKFAEEVAPLLNDDEVENHYLRTYSLIYQKMGDYEKAYKYRLSADSIHALYKTTKVDAVLIDLDEQRISYKKEVKNLTFQFRQKIRNFIILVLAVLLMLAIIIFNKKRKLNNELTESNKTKDKLFSILSHDLRGSIASIGRLAKKNKAEDLAQIKTGADAVLIEFDNLLFWSVKHLDKIELNHELVDLVEIIEEVYQLLETQFAEKNIRFIPDFADDCVAYADRNTLQLVLRNVLHNAVKYSPSDTNITVEILETSTTTTINVIDKGCGFGCDHEDKGLGLGLELCEEFVGLNNGKLVIVSSKEGSSVSIQLPIIS